MVAPADRIAKALEPMAKDWAPDAELEPEHNPFEVEGGSGLLEAMEDSDIRMGWIRIVRFD